MSRLICTTFVLTLIAGVFADNLPNVAWIAGGGALLSLILDSAVYEIKRK